MYCLGEKNKETDYYCEASALQKKRMYIHRQCRCEGCDNKHHNHFLRMMHCLYFSFVSL